MLIRRVDVRRQRERRVAGETSGLRGDWHRHCMSSSWRSCRRRGPTAGHTLLFNHTVDKKKNKKKRDEKTDLCKLKGVVCNIGTSLKRDI